MHRFCITPRAVASSQEQVIFMPPWHFSNLTVQRGTIIHEEGIAACPGIPVGDAPGMGIPIVRSSIIAVISDTPSSGAGHALGLRFPFPYPEGSGGEDSTLARPGINKSSAAT